MAFIDDPATEPQEGSMDVIGGEGQPQQPPTGGEQPPAPQTSGPMGGATITPGQPSTEPKKGVGSGAFTNIQKYIAANKPRAQKIAQAAVGRLGQRAADVRAGIEKQQQQFKTKITPEQQRLAGGKEYISQQIGQVGQREKSFEEWTKEKTGGIQWMVPSHDASAKAFMDRKRAEYEQEVGYKQFTPQQLAKFQALRTGTGQFQDIQAADFAKQARTARQLEQQAGKAGTDVGRYQMLRETFKGPTYQRGQRTLDHLLLSGEAGAREALVAGTREATRGLTGDVTGARQASAQQIGELRRQAEEARTFAGEQLGAARETLAGDIETRRTALEARRGELSQAVAEGKLSPEMLTELGLEAGRTYGVDLSKYITAGEVQASEATTQEQLARAQALAQLRGAPDQTLITDPTAVGRDVLDIYGGTAARQAIDQARGQYETEQKKLAEEQESARIVSEGLQELRDYGTKRGQLQLAYHNNQISYEDFLKQKADMDAQYHATRTKVAQHSPEAFAGRKGAAFGWDYHGMYEAMGQAGAEREAARRALEQLEQTYGGRIG